MIDEEKLHKWQNTLKWYLHLLADEELMPVRLEENVPVTVGITLLHQMKDDIHSMKSEMMRIFDMIMQMNVLDDMDDLVRKQLRALEKIQMQNYQKHLDEKKEKGKHKSDK
ncbi:hypothetical protein OAP41_00185 [Candidatus Poseidoniaceae archaeon]|nr:hypothetical protein [Candidatus Poseidoniaceae archaeon]